MMPRALPIALALLALPGMASAQSAPEEYFNKAAREYIKEDRITALRTLDAGLRAHPGDARMRRLAEAILKEQQRGSKDEQQGEQARQEEQRTGQDERGEQRERKPGELSKEEAERMLDALERREQDVQNQVRNRMRPSRRATIEKDW